MTDSGLTREVISGKRCLAYHCPDGYRNICRWHLQPQNKQVFQPHAVGPDCTVFEERQWGDGQEMSE